MSKSMVEWDDITPPKKSSGGGRKGGGSGKFLRLEANSMYRVRPVHQPIRFYKYYNELNGRLRTAICDNPDTCTVKDKHPDLRPSRRYAILVLDRNDDNKLKILEGPQTIFEEFKKYYDITKKKPGGPEGGDFTINVVCPNGKKDRDTTYTVDFINETPFTSEEKSMLVEKKDDFNLPEIFKSHSAEEIETRLFDENWPPKRDDSQAQAQSQVQAQAAPKGDAQSTGDVFDW